MEIANLYRIWYGDSNDRQEIGRAQAYDIDDVVKYVKTQYLKPNVEFYDIDYQGDDLVYLMIDMCKDCEVKANPEDYRPEGVDPCEDCEISEYIEIHQDNDTDPEFKTIFGVNEYADLTEDTRPTTYNKTLKDAWDKSPEKGVSALILQTVEDHPHLKAGFSKELIEKSRKDLTA